MTRAQRSVAHAMREIYPELRRQEWDASLVCTITFKTAPELAAARSMWATALGAMAEVMTPGGRNRLEFYKEAGLNFFREEEEKSVDTATEGGA